MKSKLSNKTILLLFFVFFSKNIFSQKTTLSPAEAIADFTFLYEKLENVHPDPYNIEQIYFQNEKERIKKKLQKNDITIEDFYLLVAPYIASVRDGHTNILPVVSVNRLKYLDSGGFTLPVKISIQNGSLIIKKILSDSPQIFNINDTIISINGMSSSNITEFLYSLIGSENNNYIKDSYIESMLSTLLWYKYNWGANYNFGIKNTEGRELNIEMPGISQQTALFYLNKIPINKQEAFEFKIDTLEKKASLSIRTFRDATSLGSFLNRVFEDVNLMNINDLTIDLKDNGGGSSASVDSLVFYLTDKPYNLYSKILLKISQEMKEIYKEKHPNIYYKVKDISNGDIFEIDSPLIHTTKDRNELYRGKLSVLCNQKTYSGASTFVSLVKCLNLGNIIGNSGQNDWHYGDFLFFRLPNSQINFTVSMKKFYDCTYMAESEKP